MPESPPSAQTNSAFPYRQQNGKNLPRHVRLSVNSPQPEAVSNRGKKRDAQCYPQKHRAVTHRSIQDHIHDVTFCVRKTRMSFITSFSFTVTRTRGKQSE